MIVKVCGMKEPENIRKLGELRPDYIGFIFYPHSKRFFGSPDPKILDPLHPATKKVGVFVNESMEQIARVVSRYQLDAVQLHGDETSEFCCSFAEFLARTKEGRTVELIKAFGLAAGFDFSRLSAFENCVDYFLFDTPTPVYGGSGEQFDWTLLRDYSGTTPFFLSGGLGPENTGAIRTLTEPAPYGIDLNSRFETEPGIKDIEKLKLVLEIVRDGDL